MTRLRLAAVLAVFALGGCECEMPPAMVNCVADEACTTNPGSPCVIGKTSCATGSSVCVDGTNASAGSVCGAMQVCDGSGACVACAQAMACATNPGAPCVNGTLDCSRVPTCRDGANVDAGTSCGMDLVCNGSVCARCVSGETCSTNPGAPCRTGVTSCATGMSTCVDSAPLDPGTPCGTGMVCNANAQCVACVGGSACMGNPGAPCRDGVMSCFTGEPTCIDGQALAAGTPCDAGMVCSLAGRCNPCVPGMACTTNAGAPCKTGLSSCTTGAQLCLDDVTLDAGTPCGTGLVCTASAQCATCVTGMPCATNPGAPCATGTTSCASGAPVCLDDLPLAPGASCGSNLVCSASGVCTPCTVGSSCSGNPGGPCFSPTTTCNTGGPVCSDGMVLAAGQACGPNQVCSPSSTCISCTGDAGCAPSANPCEDGRVECGTGAVVCASRGYFPDDTTCATASSCVRGGCEANVIVSTAVNLSTQTLVSGRTCPDAPSHVVTALSATTATLSAAPTCLAVGDEVMLINQQGASGAVVNVGAWETLTISQVAASIVTFSTPKTRAYGATAGTDTNIGTGAGQQRVSLVRVPHFGDLTVTDAGVITVDAWNGTGGGVLALRAAAVNVDGAITSARKGYRDGRWSVDGPCSGSVTTEQGESITPNGQSTSANVGGSGGLGAALMAPFAANSPITSTAGHATVGQLGLNNGARTLGAAGLTYGSVLGDLLTMGSGSAGNLTCTGSMMAPALSGAVGGSQAGGIVFIGAASISVSATGRITSEGVPTSRDTAPSGGTVMLRARTMSLGTNRVSAVGPMVIPGNSTMGAMVKAGDGYVFLFYSTTLSGTTTPAARTFQVPNP